MILRIDFYQYNEVEDMSLKAKNSADLDIYNLTAVEILEHLGYHEPKEIEINSIEQLLKSRLLNKSTDLGS